MPDTEYCTVVASVESTPEGKLILNAPLVPGSEASVSFVIVNTLLAITVLSSSAMFTVAFPVAVKLKLAELAPVKVAITVSVCSINLSSITATGTDTLFCPAGIIAVPLKAV